MTTIDEYTITLDTDRFAGQFDIRTETSELYPETPESRVYVRARELASTFISGPIASITKQADGTYRLLDDVQCVWVLDELTESERVEELVREFAEFGIDVAPELADGVMLYSDHSTMREAVETAVSYFFSARHGGSGRFGDKPYWRI